MIATLFYGSLALLALWATWRDFDLLWIGLWLFIGFVASNIMFATMPVHDLPGPYTFIETMVATAVVSAWASHRSPAMIAIVAVNLVSIGFNVAYALNRPPTAYQDYLWVAATNACFAAECLIVIGVGIAHGYRTGRFTRRLRLRRGAAAPAASRKRAP